MVLCPSHGPPTSLAIGLPCPKHHHPFLTLTDSYSPFTTQLKCPLLQKLLPQCLDTQQGCTTAPPLCAVWPSGALNKATAGAERQCSSSTGQSADMRPGPRGGVWTQSDIPTPLLSASCIMRCISLLGTCSVLPPPGDSSPHAGAHSAGGLRRGDPKSRCHSLKPCRAKGQHRSRGHADRGSWERAHAEGGL